jgi:ubiquinone/menaquinone biosynthesis C-methylase UbiE
MINEAARQPPIDVRKLMSEVSIEELCRSSDEFFRGLDLDCLLAKPFADIAETPELLICFAHVVRGLNLLPDMTVLDFGAGSCWTSRFLTQLGARVIALDVSKSALESGKKLYRRHPVIGPQPKPRFLLFDGVRIDLPDQSVDRITCWDAFHHVPNPAVIMGEMGRVLKTGGVAGFSEPGPEHSKTEQSQYEMRTNRVIENDIDVREIWQTAQRSGFTDIKLAVFNSDPLKLSLDQFEAFVAGDSRQEWLSDVRQQMQQRRMFFLFKGESDQTSDSRRRAALRAELRVIAASPRIATGQAVHLKVSAKNTGSATWLPTPEDVMPWWKKGPLARLGKQPHLGPDRVPPRVGGVRFGIQLFDEHGNLLDIDYFRYHLTPGAGREVLPGTEIQLAIAVPMPGPGKYILQCDLVSEGVCWFERAGMQPLRLPVEVF